jgi:hypothetical protein
MTAEVLASIRAAVPFHPLRLGRDPIRLAGSQEELRSAQGISVDGILAAAKKLLDPQPQANSARGVSSTMAKESVMEGLRE